MSKQKPVFKIEFLHDVVAAMLLLYASCKHWRNINSLLGNSRKLRKAQKQILSTRSLLCFANLFLNYWCVRLEIRTLLMWLRRRNLHMNILWSDSFFEEKQKQKQNRYQPWTFVSSVSSETHTTCSILLLLICYTSNILMRLVMPGERNSPCTFSLWRHSEESILVYLDKNNSSSRRNALRFFSQRVSTKWAGKQKRRDPFRTRDSGACCQDSDVTYPAQLVHSFMGWKRTSNDQAPWAADVCSDCRSDDKNFTKYLGK